MRRASPIVLAALLAATGASSPRVARAQLAGGPATQPTSFEPAQMVADQIALAARLLAEPGPDQDARDAVARRLLSIGTSEARAALASALRDPGNVPGRLAAARAIADDRPADPQFIDPLFVLLDGDTPRPLLEAAAIALGNYKAEPDVAARLAALTAIGQPDAVRVAAVRAMASLVEKRAGQRLVELTTDRSAAVAAAASDALQTFTSLQLSAPADWANWWRTQADRSDDRFRSEILVARATRFEQAARHGEETFQELSRTVFATIAATPTPQRAEVLGRYLGSPREAVRRIAVRQAYDLATTGDLPAACRPAIRTLLADAADDQVRLYAARTVRAVNDPDAFGPIAQQLAVEPDTRVRAELTLAIGPIGNVRAAPLLRTLLDDSSALVVRSAAEAIKGLGKSVVRDDPHAAAELAARLQRGIRAAGDVRLRETLLDALVSLGEPSTLATFTAILTSNPPEPESIRVLAATGLGEIGEPQTGSILVDALSDPAAPVRLAAVGALGKVSNSFFYAEAIYRSMDPQRERDGAVRKKSWEVLAQLFELAPRKQLASWPDQPLIRNDPARRIAVYGVLSTKAAADSDPDNQTYYLQQVGDAQMALAAADAARYADATATYQQALAITRATRGPSMRVETLVESTMRAMLRGRDYPGAVRFAGELVRGNAGGEYQATVGKEFKLEVERLVTDGLLGDAGRLIEQALAMTPALPAQYRDHLVEMRQTMDRRQQEKNQYAAPESLHGLASLH